MKRYFIIIYVLIGITSIFWNIKYQLRIEQLLLQIQEKDQLIKDYQFGISQIEFFDECYIGE